MKKKRVVIACQIFQDELDYVLEKENDFDLEIDWIKAGYHCLLEALETMLLEKISKKADSCDRENIRLLFGQFCLPEMPSLAANQKVKLLPTKNCLSAMVGEEKLKALERNQTMVVTCGWIRKLFLAEDGSRELLGWDAVDFRINFGRYDRLLVLDSGLNSLSVEETLAAYDLLETPLETEPISLDGFRKLIHDFLL